MEYYRNRIRLDNASVAKTVGEATEKYTAALGKAAMPGPSFRTAVTGDILNPVFNKIIAILTQLATPLVFLAVIDGIVGIGDVKSFGRIGKKVLIRMLMGYLIIMALFFIGCAFVYGIDLNAASGSEVSAVGAILKLVLDIIPDNLIQTFTIFGTIAGYVLPALNGFVLQLELLMTAVKLDKVDRARLRANAPEKPAADV